VKITVGEASTTEIAEIDSFRYDSPYEFYNGEDDPVLKPERFFAARDEDGKLIGFFNVAGFNERAIKVYERAGFRETGRHVQRFERWGDVPFVEMELAE